MVKKETFRWCPVTSSISSSPLLSRSLRAKNVFGLNSSFMQNSCCRCHVCYLWQLFLFLPNFLCCVLCQWMFDLQNIGKSYFPPYKDQHHVTRSKDICNDLSIGLTSLDSLQPLLLGLPLLVVLDFFLFVIELFFNLLFHLPTLMCRSRCSSKNRFSIS